MPVSLESFSQVASSWKSGYVRLAPETTTNPSGLEKFATSLIGRIKAHFHRPSSEENYLVREALVSAFKDKYGSDIAEQMQVRLGIWVNGRGTMVEPKPLSRREIARALTRAQELAQERSLQLVGGCMGSLGTPIAWKMTSDERVPLNKILFGLCSKLAAAMPPTKRDGSAVTPGDRVDYAEQIARDSFKDVDSFKAFLAKNPIDRSDFEKLSADARGYLHDLGAVVSESHVEKGCSSEGHVYSHAFQDSLLDDLNDAVEQSATEATDHATHVFCEDVHRSGVRVQFGQTMVDKMTPDETMAAMKKFFGADETGLKAIARLCSQEFNAMVFRANVASRDPFPYPAACQSPLAVWTVSRSSGGGYDLHVDFKAKLQTVAYDKGLLTFDTEQSFESLSADIHVEADAAGKLRASLTGEPKGAYKVVLGTEEQSAVSGNGPVFVKTDP